MPVYNSFSEMMAAAQQKCAEALTTTVADVVKDEIRNTEQDLVYGSYSPVVYDRRGSLGENFNVELISPDTVQVYDVAEPNVSLSNPQVAYSGESGQFAQWINDGDVPNIFNDNDYVWMGARPFYETATANLKSSPKIQNAIKAAFT